MSRIYPFLFCLFGLTASTAQIHEVGVFLGGSNYIGDVGSSSHINPNEFAVGVLYKWNRSPRHSWRISLMHTKLSGNDLDSDSEGRKLRGLRFDNDLKELSLGLEFNFFDFNLHDGKRKITPYVYSGFSAFIYDELFYIDQNARVDYSSAGFALPMIVGIKSNITDNLVFGAEIGARWTFTDNLDGSNPKNEDLAELQFGNLNNKDWYVFTGVTLTYTFGNKPCYCAD